MPSLAVVFAPFHSTAPVVSFSTKKLTPAPGMGACSAVRSVTVAVTTTVVPGGMADGGEMAVILTCARRPVKMVIFSSCGYHAFPRGKTTVTLYGAGFGRLRVTALNVFTVA